jgi:hypothetical protein
MATLIEPRWEFHKYNFVVIELSVEESTVEIENVDIPVVSSSYGENES